jgi:CRP-like cAMP-binding protein
MSIPSIRAAKSNRILAALPRDELERILPDLHLKSLPLKEVLQARDTPIESAVFPLSGVASMISMGDSGGSIEVATIGCEGMVGLPLLLGGQSAAGEVFMQVPGEGLLMSADSFQRHLDKPTLLRALLLYTQALLTQIAQCSACNSHHSIQGRCARWLLQTQDRVTGNAFPLTHDFLGLMLGVRRATVTGVAQALQAQGLIRYHRGVMTVIDRSGLERAACECYRLIQREYTRLMKSVNRPLARRASKA